MEESIYLVLAALGLIATGIGLGGYIRGRKSRNVTLLPDHKPPATDVIKPIPSIAPSKEDVVELDERTATTDSAIAETTKDEFDIDNTTPPTDAPDPNVVSFLRRQRDDN